MFIISLLLSLIFFQSSHCAAQGEFIDFNDTHSNELFSTVDAVAHLLYYYDQQLCSGLEVDFQTNGAFYLPSKGKNWWTYYFEPIAIGNPVAAIPFPYTERQALQLTAKHVQRLAPVIFTRIFRKYIKPNLYLKTKIAEFAIKNFKKQMVLGVHYSNKKVPYEIFLDTIHAHMKKNRGSSFVIFVSTTVPQFLDIMRMRFPNRVVALSGPIENKNPYLYGERQLMDCLLLAKSQVLIHTPSKLSKWAIYLKPSLKHEPVTQNEIPDRWKKN